MADNDEQMTMDDILTAEQPAPEPGTVEEETLSLDERERLESALQTPEPEGTTAPEQAAPAPAAQQQEPEPEGNDLPPFMHEKYLERKPEDASNWRELRTMAKDFKASLAEATKKLEETEKARAEVERELAELRAQQARQQFQPQQQPQPGPQQYAPAPAPQDDAVWNAKLDISEANAIGTHGQEKVNQAFEWASKAAQMNPGFAQQLRGQLDPWGWVVQEMDRQALLSDIGNDPNAYRAKVEAELRQKWEAEQAQANAEANQSAAAEAARTAEQEIQRRLPSSLANVPNVGTRTNNEQWTGPAPMGQLLDSALDK